MLQSHTGLRAVEVGCVAVSLRADEVVIALDRALDLDRAFQVGGWGVGLTRPCPRAYKQTAACSSCSYWGWPHTPASPPYQHIASKGKILTCAMTSLSCCSSSYA